MKNRIALFLFGLFASVVIAGCHVSTSPTGSNTTSGSMTATVNGKSWSTIGIGSLVQSAHAVRSDTGSVTVIGADIDGSSLWLVLLHPALGTVTLGTTGNEGIFSYTTYNSSAPKAAYYSTTGSVNVTKFDTTNRLISGTFSFTGYQILDTTFKSVEVKNGTFVDVGWSK